MAICEICEKDKTQINKIIKYFDYGQNVEIKVCTECFFKRKNIMFLFGGSNHLIRIEIFTPYWKGGYKNG